MTSSSDSNSLSEDRVIDAPWFALLSTSLKQALQKIPISNNYFVAFSGGLDSSLLLVLASRYLSECRQASVTAIHVHHGISDNADQWQAHCGDVCRDLDVELIVRRVSLKRDKKGVEDAARVARYAVFEEILPVGAVLLQGHHQNDQAETVLLRLMRGAGVKGVAGIPRTRELNSALIDRPFLGVSRSELVRLANDFELKWVEDDSNALCDYDRNYIRHEVIPRLENRWGGAVGRLAASADHCRESAELEKALANIDLNDMTHNVYGSALMMTELMKLPISRQRNAVRYWLQQQALGFPGEKRFQRIWSELLVARDDANPLIEWSLGAVRRYRDALFAVSLKEINALSEFMPSDIRVGYGSQLLSSSCENGSGASTLFERKIMAKVYSLCSVVNNDSAADIDSSAHSLQIKAPSDEEQVSIKFRQGGELFKPVGKAHHRPLKKWFHDSHVPPWLRDSLPLLYYNEDLVAIGNLLVADGYQASEEKESLVIKWD